MDILQQVNVLESESLFAPYASFTMQPSDQTKSSIFQIL